MIKKTILRCGFVIPIIVASSIANALDLVWDDGGGAADKAWSNPANFNPNNLPDAADDLFIGVNSNNQGVGAATNDATLLDRSFNIHSLTIGNGADVTNSDDGGLTTYGLGVGRSLPLFTRGGVVIGSSGGTSVLTLYRAPSATQRSLQTDFLTINDGGQVRMISSVGDSTLEVDDGFLVINNGGELSGAGIILLEDQTVSPTKFFNNGTLTASSPSSLPSAPPAGTLRIQAASTNARFDWDGTGNGRIRINGNQTLDIDVRQANDFHGTLNMATGSVLDVQETWKLGNGLIKVDAAAFGFVPIGQDPNPGSAARIAGAGWTMTGGSILLEDSWDTLQFDAEFVASGGTISNSGHLVFNADATISSTANLAMLGNGASVSVGPAVTLTIDDADFNFDGNESATNVLTVENQGELNLNLNTFDVGSDKADGVMTLDGGQLQVTVSDNSWIMDGALNLNTTGNSPAILSGSSVTIGDDFAAIGGKGNVNVTGSGVSRINTGVTWNSDANVHVAAGASLSVSGPSIFRSVNSTQNASFSGAGSLYLSGGTVEEATVLDFSGGTVGMDGRDEGMTATPAFDFTIGDPLTVYAAQVDDYGLQKTSPASTSELIINTSDGGRLNVFLDDSASAWTVNQAGVMYAINNSSLRRTFLNGSPLNMNGTLNVQGENTSWALLSIGGEVNLLDATSDLRIAGLGLPAPSRLVGGSIQGSGSLSAPSSGALHGFGRIEARIDFDHSNSELMADDGILTIGSTANIIDAGVVGTADDDGILAFESVWNTNLVNQVELRGGELTGATIINSSSNGIRGRGLISAQISNETSITADAGGTLVVNNPENNNNWDGAGNNGSLRAFFQSTLEIHNPAGLPFNGTVMANNARVHAVNSGIPFSTTSELVLANGGVYSADLSGLVDLRGAITVGLGAPSRIELSGGSGTFSDTSTTTLNGDLILDMPQAFISSAATISGGGALINEAARRLHLRDGAAVDVLLINRGTLSSGDIFGQTTGFEYQQTASGEWELGIGGAGLNEFDRMLLTGAASLSGTLELSLQSNFVPTLGDTFDFLSANGGITGAFASVLQPTTMPSNLAFDVNYLGSIVQLEVVQIPDFTADFDNDGDVDADDLLLWQGDYGGPGSDSDLDGDSDGSDFLAWQRQFGSSTSSVAASPVAVPEPSGLLLAGLGTGCGVAFSGRRKRR